MEGRSGKKSYVTWFLMAANALYFLYLEITGSSEDAYFMYTKGAMLAPAVLEDREYYRLFTAMFMHFGIGHLVNNMIVLFAMGDYLERAMGHVKYLVLYLVCGAGANWISMMVGRTDSMVVSAGASGAVFGITGGLFYVAAVNRGKLEDLSAKRLAFMIGLSLYMGVASSGVDNAAHAAGLVLGILLGAVLYRKPKKKESGGIWNER